MDAIVEEIDAMIVVLNPGLKQKRSEVIERIESFDAVSYIRRERSDHIVRSATRTKGRSDPRIVSRRGKVLPMLKRINC